MFCDLLSADWWISTGLCLVVVFVVVVVAFLYSAFIHPLKRSLPLVLVSKVI